MGTKNKITFWEAIKDTFSFLFKSGYHKQENENSEILDDPDAHFIPCPRCQTPLIMVNQLVADFLTMVIYRCPDCGVTKEIQFNQDNGELMKEVTLYDQFAHTSSTFMEIVNECKINEFAIDRLWEIGGELCYPILVKTEFSPDVDLVFIRVQDDLSREFINGYVITSNNSMIGKVRFQKTDNFSYFLNPYLYKIPHSTYLYAAQPLSNNDNIARVSPIRYRFKIASMKNSYLCELSIIEDFPVQSYGIEVFVKFGTFTNPEEFPLIRVIKMIDLKAIITGTEPHINENEGIFIKQQTVSKINLYSSTCKHISKGLREHFYESIVNFFTVTE